MSKERSTSRSTDLKPIAADRSPIVSVVGLGYVGLPLAVEFARHFKTIGFDINADRVAELARGLDKNGEVSSEELRHENLTYTSDLEQLRAANFHIVAVPTPIDAARQPDLVPIISATKTVGKVLKAGDVVVYESTVYPGLTEEICLPLLETTAELHSGVDFWIGYSPERINPGDREHGLRNIVKVVSAQDERTLEVVARVYGKVVDAGVFRAQSIKVAEAAKVIENTQRDLNIALMNELALIFDRMGIDTQSVLKAAGTKWNFLKFTPGLVGGHCIGVDPYYLTHKAEKLNYIPQVILAGRRINDGMGSFIAHRTLKELIRAGHKVRGSRVTVLGLTFKENVRDLRNTRVVDIVNELTEYGVEVQVSDPMADPGEAQHEYGIFLYSLKDLQPADAVVLCVGHRQFEELRGNMHKLLNKDGVLIDVKGFFSADDIKKEGLRFWRL